MNHQKFWIFSIIPENWEILKAKEIWAFSSDRLISLVTPGDFAAMYVKETNEFQGAYQFVGDWYKASEPVWFDEMDIKEILYPHQIKIKLIQLGRANVPRLAPRLAFIEKKPYWYTYLMGSLANFGKPISKADFGLILEEMKKTPAEEKVAVAPRELAPEKEAGEIHTSIQGILLNLGKLGGYDVWVARNDRSKSYNGERFENICLKSLPNLGFEEEVARLVEMIDVLWVKGKMILAAFEIEHSTAIYSGLLRLSDLVSLQPNVTIPLFIATSEERKGRVIKEVNRPTFCSLPRHMNDICMVSTYEDLRGIYENIKGSRVPPTWNLETVKRLGESCLIT